MMFLRIVIVAVFTLGVSNVARAQNAVNFSAGEHGDHSRIVVAGETDGLNITQSGRDIDIRFAKPVSTFNFSDVNERRKAHRVLKATRAMTSAGSIVRLQLNCDCVLKTKELEDGKWILDIYDDDAPHGGAAPPLKTADASPLPKNKSQPEAARSARQSNDAKDLSVEQAHKRMLDLLEQAAEEGLVTIRSDGGKPDALAQAEAEENEQAIASEPQQNHEPNAKTAAAEQTTPPHPCFPDEAFAIDGARFEENPLVEISELQARLANTSPEAQQQIVEDLAGGFLAIGFGEEAFALLADNGEDETLLADMARTVAEKPVSPSGALLNAVDCRGAHAFWQAAASDPALAADELKRSGDAVSTLPTRLRALLATRLAGKMIDAGDWDAANQYYDIASAASEIPSAKLRFVAAKLRAHEGDIDDSQKMLRGLAAGDSDASKDALLTLAEQYAEGEGKPHEGFAEDIGALAKVERGSKAGAEAAFVEADIWAKTGDVEASMLLLEGAADSDPAKAGVARAKAREILTLALSSDNENAHIDALGAYLEYREFLDAPGEGAAFSRKIAKAALDLGLPNVAFDVIKAGGVGEKKETAKLKTLAALDAHDPDAALATAAPYTNDPEFAEMVVRADMQQQKFYAALAAASALPDTDRKMILTAQSAWRAGDWESAAQAFARIDPKLMGQTMALQYAMAAYMAGQTTMPPVVEAVLRKEKSGALDGAKSLFSGAPAGPVVNRGKALAASADKELRMIMEELGHG